MATVREMQQRLKFGLGQFKCLLNQRLRLAARRSDDEDRPRHECLGIRCRWRDRPIRHHPMPFSAPRRKPPCVFTARYFRNRAFIVPFRPTCGSLISPRPAVTIGIPTNFRCLYRLTASA